MTASPFNYSNLTLEELRTLAASPQVGAMEAMPHAFRHLATQVGEVADLLSRAQADLPTWWKGPAADQAAATLSRAAAEAHEFQGSALSAATAVARCATIVAEQQHQMMNIPELPEPGVTAIIEPPKTPMEALEAARQDAAYQAARERAVQVVNGIAAQYVETREHLAVIGTPRGEDFKPISKEPPDAPITEEPLQGSVAANDASLKSNRQYVGESTSQPDVDFPLQGEPYTYRKNPLAAHAAMPEAYYRPHGDLTDATSHYTKAVTYNRGEVSGLVESTPLHYYHHSKNDHPTGETDFYAQPEHLPPVPPSRSHGDDKSSLGYKSDRQNNVFASQEQDAKNIGTGSRSTRLPSNDEEPQGISTQTTVKASAVEGILPTPDSNPRLSHSAMGGRVTIHKDGEGRAFRQKNETSSSASIPVGSAPSPSFGNAYHPEHNEASGTGSSPFIPPLGGTSSIRRQREDRSPRPAYLKERRNVWLPDTIAAPADGIITPEWFEQR